jgi:flagellar hook-associated protein 2
MSMTLQEMATIATLNNNIYSAGNTTTNPVTKAFDAASQRIGTQISQTNVQLSSYGQIQSGFASLQTAGKSLSSLSPTATASTVSTAAQNFAKAYNTTNSAVSTSINGAGTSKGALANDQLARVAGNDLHGISTNGVSAADLQKIGISTNKDGSLSLDTTALANAMAANPTAVTGTLAKLGRNANTTATNELSSSGVVGNAVNTLTSQVKTLASEQSQQVSLAASAQAAIQQSSNQIAGLGGVNAGIVSYMQMFSL